MSNIDKMDAIIYFNTEKKGKKTKRGYHPICDSLFTDFSEENRENWPHEMDEKYEYNVNFLEHELEDKTFKELMGELEEEFGFVDEPARRKFIEQLMNVIEFHEEAKLRLKSGE